jgi:hypothetical protein
LLKRPPSDHANTNLLWPQQSSQIGTFDVSVINFFLDALFDNVLLYPVNEYLMLYPLFTFPPLAGTRYVSSSPSPKRWMQLCIESER